MSIYDDLHRAGEMIATLTAENIELKDECARLRDMLYVARTCQTCRHYELNDEEVPCCTCVRDGDFPEWDIAPRPKENGRC